MRYLKIILLICLGIGPMMVSAGMVIAESGKPGCVIVGNAATEAVKELQTRLRQITGADFAVIPEKDYDGQGAAIFVGDSQFAKKNGIDFTAFQPEEWLYQTIGNHLVLGGHPFHGVEFAVYEFLERELNCHWFTFESEYIPKRAEITLPALKQRGRPAFIGRHIYMPPWHLGLSAENTQRVWRFMRWNRGNPQESPQIESKQYRRHHNFYYFMPPEKYFKTNPEYFSMNASGKRFHGNTQTATGGQLCLSNPQVANTIAENLKVLIRKERATLPKEQWPVLYDISQLDNTDFICLCPECKKLTKAEGGESALVLTLINRIAESITEEYPEVTLRTFAYVSTEKAPKTLRPAKNVQIQWCDLYTRSDCYRPLESRFNMTQKAKLEGWKDLGARLAVWDYWNMGIKDGPYFSPPRVEVMIDAVAPDIRYFQKVGVESIFCEAETQLFGNPQNFYDLQLWLGYQLLNDPAQDEERLIHTFMKYHYGPAAATMTSVLAMLRKAVKAEKEALIYISNPVREYQTGEFLEKVYLLLQEARKQTLPETPYRLRVEKELITPIAVILQNPQLQTGLDKAVLLQEYEAFRRVWINAYCDVSKQAAMKKELADDMEKLQLEIPTPEQFRHLPPEKIKKFAYPVFNQVVNDPDSVIGKAMASTAEASQMKHRMAPQAAGLYPTWFGVYDWGTKQGIQFRLNEIPQDEKYHWYKVGSFEFGRKTKLWGWFWKITANLGTVWTNADGLPGYNIWEVWISAKITGSAYVKGSKQKNRIFVDQVVLVKP